MKTVYLAAATEIRNRAERANQNRYDWGVFGVIIASQVLDQTAVMTSHVGRVKAILDTQINSEGKLGAELGRGDLSMMYTGWALIPISASVETLRNAGLANLYTYTGTRGGTLFKALSFLYQNGCVTPSNWPVPAAAKGGPCGRERNKDLLYAMGWAYQHTGFRTFASIAIGPSTGYSHADLLRSGGRH